MKDKTAETNTRDTMRQAIQSLAMAMEDTAEFQAFQEANLMIVKDDAVQNLLRQADVHRVALQWGQGDEAEHMAALQHLQASLESYASVQAYRHAEQAMKRLCRAVDTVISETAGVNFAANAKRSCCG